MMGIPGVLEADLWTESAIQIYGKRVVHQLDGLERTSARGD